MSSQWTHILRLQNFTPGSSPKTNKEYLLYLCIVSQNDDCLDIAASMCLLEQMFMLFYQIERFCGQNAESSCMNHLKHGLHFCVWVHTVTRRHNLYAEQPPTNTPASVNRETENTMLLQKQKCSSCHHSGQHSKNCCLCYFNLQQPIMDVIRWTWLMNMEQVSALLA